MPLNNDKSVLEVLHDVGFLPCRPASLKDILEYMCSAHPDVSNNLLTDLQLTLDAGVQYGYVDQVDENCYVSSRREDSDLYRLEPSNTRENIRTCSEDNEAMDCEILYCQSKENGTVNSENKFNAEIKKTSEDTKPKSNSNPTYAAPSTSAPSSSSPKSRSQESEFKARKQIGRRKSSNERKPKRRIVANRNRKRKPQRRRQ
uniref:Uncharacterized protein n=1 Tax=Glossina pallidipes TaxID=7398 RepID=A0A1A9ZJL7_GLOPL